MPSKKRKKEIFDEEFIRKLEYWSLAFKRLYGGELSAARRSKEVGSGIEFSDRREYMAGDDFRYVDWKALGRMDRAFVRLFVEEKDLKVNLLIDASASMDVGDPPKIETALKLGAVLSYMVLFNLDRVALTIFSEGVEDYTPPARGKARIRKILDTLREIEPGGKTDFKKLATGVAGRDSKAGLIIIISDLMVGDGFDECISRLMYGGSEVSVIRVLAPEDEKPPLMGEVQLLDSETGAKMNITATPRLVSRYKAAFAAMSKRLEEEALRRGVRFVTIRSDQTFDDQVSTVLRSMAKRK